MAFCTSCGATLEPSARFCPSCGATATPQSTTPSGIQAAAAKPSPSPAQAAPAPQSGNAVKVILIIVGIVVGLFLLGSLAIGFTAWRVAHRIKVDAGREHARIETPFGTVESSNNSADVARELHVDVYPGARPLQGAAVVNFAGMKTASAEFETPDAPEKVEAFYESRFPRSQINVSDEHQRTMISSNDKGMLTIVIEPRGNMTHIQISNVGGKAVSNTQPEPK